MVLSGFRGTLLGGWVVPGCWRRIGGPSNWRGGGWRRCRRFLSRRATRRRGRTSRAVARRGIVVAADVVQTIVAARIVVVRRCLIRTIELTGRVIPTWFGGRIVIRGSVSSWVGCRWALMGRGIHGKLLQKKHQGVHRRVERGETGQGETRVKWVTWRVQGE